jgi:hypothetical protein
MLRNIVEIYVFIKSKTTKKFKSDEFLETKTAENIEDMNFEKQKLLKISNQLINKIKER